MRFADFGWMVVAVATLTCSVACKKSSEESGPTSFTIPGAADVTGALDKADYHGAVQALMQVKANLAEPQRLEYNRLLQKVKDTMVTAMATNDSAIKAYQALRIIEAGR